VVAKPVEREPANQSIYFQKGKVRAWYGWGTWRTLCRLRVGDEVSSESLHGSEYEVISVRRATTPFGEIGEVYTVAIALRTIKGAQAEELFCEIWHDYLLETHAESDITLAEFEDAVNGYIQIVGHDSPSRSEAR